jgi:predicted NodU family carbamoyl transferase
MMDLLLTLGHNSSAIGTDGARVIGYEEERFTRRKGDSSFPYHSIAEIIRRLGHPSRTFVSHWFDDFTAASWPAKYWSTSHVDFALSPQFSHHDAHARSAVSFARAHGWEPPCTIVADGFGNLREVTSIYQGSTLRHRIHGYANSIGLMYQYATAYVGLHELQDEWKLLGYESKVQAHLPGDYIALLSDASHVIAGRMLDGANPDLDLAQTRQSWYEHFTQIASKHNRITSVAFYVQAIVESYYDQLLRRFDITEAAFAGGVHYNVKLNSMLAYRLHRSCFCPLAGDQGACIGLWEHVTQQQFPFTGLCWGERDLGTVDPELVADALVTGRCANVVHGNAEFGPRALCNTSTLAVPSPEWAQRIDAMNGRDPVMPFAPVMTEPRARRLFGDVVDRVVGSLQYMILALDCLERPDHQYSGCSLRHPLHSTYSMRPQVVPAGHFAAQLLGRLVPPYLINTSFNVHGRPIVHTTQHAQDDFAFQRERDSGSVLLIGGAS